MKQVEQIYLGKTKDLYNLCHQAKDLYNKANYVIRQEFFRTNRWTRYNQLNEILKSEKEYKGLPSQTSQQVLILLDKNWKSFFKAIKDWRVHPEKYLGRPKPPKYKKKNGESIVVFTNQQCKIKDGFVQFPKKCNLESIKTRILDKFHQIRIVPRGLSYILEIVYEKEPINLELDKSRVLGIDLGLRNLATCVNNIGLKPFVIKGGIVKSINQFYNKQRAMYQSKKDLQKYTFETKKMQKLTLKRNNKMRDYFHKASKKIINFCIENNLGTIVLGYNEGWKQDIKLGRQNNQNFVNIPFLKLVHQLQYKSELFGIDIKIISESYSSKCSFLDNESPEKHDTYVGKRISRGIFETRNGILINADCNGAYNIIKKAVPNAFADGIEGVGLHPYSIAIEPIFATE